MSFDATVERLTGAHILRVERHGSCVELFTDKGRVIMGADRVLDENECYGCGESRSVAIVETAGRKEYVCDICGRSWKLL